jgi:hypothetical protein
MSDVPTPAAAPEVLPIRAQAKNEWLIVQCATTTELLTDKGLHLPGQATLEMRRRIGRVVSVGLGKFDAAGYGAALIAYQADPEKWTDAPDPDEYRLPMPAKVGEVVSFFQGVELLLNPGTKEAAAGLMAVPAHAVICTLEGNVDRLFTDPDEAAKAAFERSRIVHATQIPAGQMADEE